MKKMTTLFKKDPNDLGRVIKEVNPENEWVINGYGIPTRKFDGTACAIIDGVEVLKIPYLTFEGIKTYLENHDIEGIVFHHKEDGRMCKIRKTDFGIKRI